MSTPKSVIELAKKTGEQKPQQAAEHTGNNQVNTNNLATTYTRVIGTSTVWEEPVTGSSSIPTAGAKKRGLRFNKLVPPGAD